MKKISLIIFTFIVLNMPAYTETSSDEGLLIQIRTNISQAEALMTQIKKDPSGNATLMNYNRINGYLDTAKQLLDETSEESDVKARLVSKYKAVLNEWESIKKAYFRDKISLELHLPFIAVVPGNIIAGHLLFSE